MNIGMRYLTTKDVQQLPTPDILSIDDELMAEFANMELPEYIYKDTREPPQILEEVKVVEVKPEDLSALGAAPKQNTDAPVVPSENERLAAEVDVEAATAANTAANAGPGEQQLPQQQQQQQQMPVMMPMMVPMMMAPQGMQQGAPPLQYINPAGPGAPPTLVVDTSREAMEESGFVPQQQQGQPQARPANNQTRRNSRGVSFQPPQQQQQQGGQQHNVKVTINKLG